MNLALKVTHVHETLFVNMMECVIIHTIPAIAVVHTITFLVETQHTVMMVSASLCITLEFGVKPKTSAVCYDTMTVAHVIVLIA